MPLNDLIVNFRAFVYSDKAVSDYVELVSDLAFNYNYFILAVSSQTHGPAQLL